MSTKHTENYEVGIKDRQFKNQLKEDNIKGRPNR